MLHFFLLRSNEICCIIKTKFFIISRKIIFLLNKLWLVTICSSKTTNHNKKLKSKILKS